MCKFCNIRKMPLCIFIAPKFTVMPSTTSIEVKCECTIPFHSELVGYLEQELNSPLTEDAPVNKVPHRETIMRALQNRMLFIKVTQPLKRLRPRLVRKLKKIFEKDFVGSIEVDADEITLILL